MAKLNLVIADSDETYLDSLWKYMQLAKTNHIILEHKFTSRDALASFLDRRLSSGIKPAINILLLKPDFLIPSLMNTKELQSLGIDFVLLLTNNQINDNEYPFPQIYKYLTADSLLDKITNMYLKKMRINLKSIKGEQKTDVISFFSASPSAGKTTLALAMAKVMANWGKKVFYFNMEPIPALHQLLAPAQGEDMSQLLFYVKDDPATAPEKIHKAIETNDPLKFDYIALYENSFHILDMTTEHLRLIIRTLVDLSIYDMIILDLESSLNEKTKVALEEQSNAFVWVHGSLDDAYHVSKAKQLEEDIDGLPFERSQLYFDKCVPVINRCYYGDLQLLGKNAVAKVPYVRNIFTPQDGFITGSEANGFWQNVSYMADYILKMCKGS